ncbi:hypothetical protein ECG_08009 [Echinococcus granulosus]|uniref:Ovule protein n=1 Tax=Echinococcus granulosus TaxID=6210 RepID=A0A068X368_ECHGR|nr:hypothetical protein ECG_08009 [Echinococcus granulosus]CDS24332.1 hypothetical protein EgrG_000316800 [Echinococcus granulosus]
MVFYQINRLNLGKPEANSSGLLQDLRVQSTAPPDPKRQSLDSAGISIAESHNGSQSGSNFDLLHEDASRGFVVIYCDLPPELLEILFYHDADLKN